MTYLVFLKNAVTREEFVAPMAAESREAAMLQASTSYPMPAYAHLTCYALEELQRILADVQRWPGVPSKVQPTIETLMAKMRDGGRGLPPMPTRSTVPAAQPAMVKPMATATPPAPKKIVTTPAVNARAPSVIEVLKAMRGG